VVAQFHPRQRQAHALYFLIFAAGGPGFSVPLGLLIAGISVTAGFTQLLPKWLVVFSEADDQPAAQPRDPFLPPPVQEGRAFGPLS
jgi:hypothetical protein